MAAVDRSIAEDEKYPIRGGYRYLEQVGRGTFSKVYRAELVERPGEYVAIKESVPSSGTLRRQLPPPFFDVFLSLVFRVRSLLPCAQDRGDF